VTGVGCAGPVLRRLSLARRGSPCLLVRAKEDANAFADFYDAYSERVVVYFMRRVLDADVALDLVAETFATALEQRFRFRGDTPEQEQGWLFAIARSELSHYWRHGRVERSALKKLGVPVPGLTDPDIERFEDMAGLSAVAATLRGAMAGLPEDQRRAVELRVVDELGYADVAVVLGITEQTARARVSRGLRALALALREPDQVLEDAA
jgi:RNA polymerase sigma factor (sigma-70 family)